MVLSISDSKERKLDEVKKIFKSPLTERDGGKKTANKRVRGSGDKFKEYIEKIINDPDIDNLITVHAPFAHGEYILTAEKIFSLDKWVDNPPKDEYNFDFKIDDLYASLEAFASDDVECKDDSFENNERFFSLKNRYNISDNISTNLIGDLGELISIVFLEEEHNFVDVSLSIEGDSFDIVAYKNDEIYYFEVKTKLKESNTSTATITEGEKEHLNKNKNTFVILVEVESSFVKMFEETLKNMYGEVSNINATDMINALETLKSSNQFLVIKYEVNMYDWKDIRDDESRIKTKCIAEIKF